jgi:integrase
MLNPSPDSLKLILLCVCDTGMCKAEIPGLTWERVEFKSGGIRLKEADTNTGERRSIPIGGNCALC